MTGEVGEDERPGVGRRGRLDMSASAMLAFV